MSGGSCVVVGVDASPESLAAVEWAVELAKQFGGRVVAVHAVGLLEGQHLRPHPDVEATVTAARALHGDRADVDVDTIYQDGVPAEIITQVAEEQRAALIVVGSRGIGRATRLLGSTSEAVLARASIPVLIVPAGSAVPDYAKMSSDG
jgi:nucleotide-binding universal stress UspA family protein